MISSLFLVLQKGAGAKGGGRVDGLWTFVDVLDHSALVDHKSNSVGKQPGEIEDAVSLGSCLVGVAEDWEGGPDLCREYPVRLRFVDTYSKYLRVGRRKLGNISLICLEFFRSTRRAGLYVKGKDDSLLPPEVA